jgi:hypothetical protein
MKSGRSRTTSPTAPSTLDFAGTAPWALSDGARGGTIPPVRTASPDAALTSAAAGVSTDGVDAALAENPKGTSMHVTIADGTYEPCRKGKSRAATPAIESGLINQSSCRTEV